MTFFCLSRNYIYSATVTATATNITTTTCHHCHITDTTGTAVAISAGDSGGGGRPWGPRGDKAKKQEFLKFVCPAADTSNLTCMQLPARWKPL